ncbi:cytochrome c oxidase assembly protein COX14 homolog [Triplophysa dalaica]|uniref:cytochrome c oxidase assembly protein COX14 homolog n=1 Tax=Triplophysa dalaica TaxID=1582913 RepID=UPI0024E0336B|nr:cytochrome c oxidase assembly protein COX14 homolog [Triplophysa dalaica]
MRITHLTLTLRTQAHFLSFTLGLLNRSIMVLGKRIADAGYKIFSGSMMLLTVYGGYLCVLRAKRYMDKQNQLQLEAPNQSTDSEAIKD